eukprot:9501424-Pyramimonas_sp.AAC.1
MMLLAAPPWSGPLDGGRTLTAASRSRRRADRRLRLATRRQAEVDAWGWWGIPWEGAYEEGPWQPHEDEQRSEREETSPCEKWEEKIEPNTTSYSEAIR